MHDEIINDVRDNLTSMLTESLDDLMEGAKEDIQAYAGQMAASAAQAVMLGSDARTALLNELIDQSRLLAEKNRLRVVNERQEMFDRTMDLLVRKGTKFAISAAQVALKAALA